MDRGSKKGVGRPCGKNGGQPSGKDRERQSSTGIVQSRQTERNAGKKVSSKPPRLNLWKDRHQPIGRRRRIF